MKSNETKKLPLDQIHIDGGTQPRVAIDEQIVAEYAELYASGADLPPVTVFFDGVVYWLADGFHRYHASRRAGRDEIPVEVHDGLLRDAILYSVGANAAHGLRRTNADKRKAVLTLLEDDEWSGWTNCEIARRCGVNEKTVRRTRDSLTSAKPKYGVQPRDEAMLDESSSMKSNTPTTRTFTHPKTGKPTQMNTAKIGRTKQRQKPRKPGGISPDAFKPIRQPRPALAQTSLNLPHDPVYGARAIVSAMGVDYARNLIDSLAAYLEDLSFPAEADE